MTQTFSPLHRWALGVSAFLPLPACSGALEPEVGVAADLALCTTPPPADVMAERSLVVRQRAVVEDGNRFAFERVLGQLASTSGDPTLTARVLYQRLFETNNDAAHA